MGVNMRSYFLILVVLLLAGCAKTYRYTRPGFNEVTFNRDIAQCRLMARNRQSSAVRVGATSFRQSGAGDVNDGVMNDCMQAKGYSVSTE
jgi:hypothetical protein